MPDPFPPAPWDPPTDPAYLRFVEGLKQVAADPKGKIDWKWHSRESKWYRYAVADWAMDDLGIADTPAGEVLRSQGWPQPVWEVNSFRAPELFTKVQKTHAELATRFPGTNLVWSAMAGGTWRNAIRRQKPPPPPSPPPPLPPGKGPLPSHCLEEINRVRLFEQGGYITHDEAQRQINKIVEECS